MEPLHHAADAAKLNIIFWVSGLEPGDVEYRVHLGNSHVLPPDFRRVTHCRVNPLLFLLNFLVSLCGNAPFCGECSLRFPNLSSTQEHWALLRRAGFFLFDERRGEWSPADIYTYRLERGLETAHMPTLSVVPGGLYVLLSTTEEKAKGAAPQGTAPEDL